MQFEVRLKFEKGRNWPQINFNGLEYKTHETHVNENVCLTNYAVIPDDDRLILCYHNKTDDETVMASNGTIEQDQTVEIESIWADDIKLDRNIIWNLGIYTPTYRSSFLEYCQQNNIDVEHGPSNQLKFWHNGSWKLEWDSDFWFWYQSRRRELESNMIAPQDVSKLLQPVWDHLK